MAVNCLKKRMQRFLSAVPVFSMLAVIAGIYGFVYEFIFYYINGDMQNYYWRGSHFLPWILIYSVGGIVIYLLTYRLKRNPVLVCLVGGLGCGALEYISGLALFYLYGKRAWDYNTEKWNFGNIGGFICLRSIMVFALSSLLLLYVIFPFIRFIQKKLGTKAFAVLSLSITGVFLADQLYNSVIARAFTVLVSANTFYANLGLNILQY